MMNSMTQCMLTCYQCTQNEFFDPPPERILAFVTMTLLDFAYLCPKHCLNEKDLLFKKKDLGQSQNKKKIEGERPLKGPSSPGLCYDLNNIRQNSADTAAGIYALCKANETSNTLFNCSA